MKQYESYGVEDFIQDEDFRDWVRGQSRQESFWLTFLQQYPHQREVVHLAEQFIRAATVAPEPISESEIRKEVEFFIEKADAYTSIGSPSADDTDASLYRFVTGRRVALAAVLTLAVLIGAYSFMSRLEPPLPIAHLFTPAKAELVETTNPTRHPIRLVLNDGSEVILSPGSRLRYPSRFSGNARVVYLKGEGIFSVTHQRQPFRVHTGDMVTRVLGTRFVVRAFDADRKFTVQVLSGKVSVYKPKAQESTESKQVNGLILNVNQAAIFEKGDGNLTKTLVANPSVVDEKGSSPRFVYDEKPLPAILRELEQAYAIPIQFDEQAFSECNITAVLTHEALYQKLDILCKAASASYEITDGQIVISRKGYK